MMLMRTSACRHHLQCLHRPILQNSQKWQHHCRRADDPCSMHLSHVWLQATASADRAE